MMKDRCSGGQQVQRDVGGNLPPLGEDAQVVLGSAVHRALPAADGAVVDRERQVRDREPVVDLDDPAEAPALRAGAEGRVEGEEGRRRRAKLAPRLRRMKAAGIVAELPVPLSAEDADFAAPEVHRRLHRLGEPSHRRLLDLQPVLDDVDPACPRERTRVREEVVDAVDAEVSLRGAWRKHANVRLVLQVGEDLRPAEALRLRDLEGDEDGGAGARRKRLSPDGLGAVVLHLFPGVRVVALRDVAEPHLEEVGQLGHRPHGRARGLHRVGLLDGDRGADVLDRVDARLVEKLQELARVGAERFDVPPLALRVQRLEHEGALPGAAQPRHDHVLPERHIQVETLQVVLADAAKADAFRLRGRSAGFFLMGSGHRLVAASVAFRDSNRPM